MKALVVDDEKLVRKGFISLVDWSIYGIEIVGEAADSYRALQLLQQQPSIDLMFVDITMPGMSGFELIKQVRQKNSSIHFVILTCHHEFDYIQEALRLGAIDYIVKTLLNKDNVDDTMKRISGRLKLEIGRKDADAHFFSSAIVVRSRDEIGSAEEIRDALPEEAAVVPLSAHLHICYLGGNDCYLAAKELRHRLNQHWDVIEATASARITREDAEALILKRLEHYLFYAYPSSSPEVSIRELADLHKASENYTSEFEKLQEEWFQFKWLLYGKGWISWNDKISSMRPNPDFLTGFMKELCREWLLYMEWSPQEMAVLATEKTVRTWSEMGQAIMALSLVVQRRMADLSLSREVVLSLIRSLWMIDRQACEDLTQNDVAKAVNMSRSYFSQCFKLFVGNSFGEVLRKVRIDRAKRLLLESSMSISEISGAVGFLDNKYFSRAFKEKVGVYPTEYRIMHEAIEVIDR